MDGIEATSVANRETRRRTVRERDSVGVAILGRGAKIVFADETAGTLLGSLGAEPLAKLSAGAATLLAADDGEITRAFPVEDGATIYVRLARTGITGAELVAAFSFAAPPLAVGLRSLTRAENAVVALVCQGKTNREIANARDVAVGTVVSHLKRIFRKLHVRNRAELVALVVRRAGRQSATANPRTRVVSFERRAKKAGLSPAETEAARYAARGWKNREIAEEVGVSPVTIGCRLTSAYRKTGTRNRCELGAYLGGIVAETEVVFR